MAITMEEKRERNRMYVQRYRAKKKNEKEISKADSIMEIIESMQISQLIEGVIK